MTPEERWIALNEIFRAEGLASETHALEWLIQQYRLKKLLQTKAPWDDNTDDLETINKRMELKESDWRATFESNNSLKHNNEFDVVSWGNMKSRPGSCPKYIDASQPLSVARQLRMLADQLEGVE